jgi:hypothetical protein
MESEPVQAYNTNPKAKSMVDWLIMMQLSKINKRERERCSFYILKCLNSDVTLPPKSI